MKIEIKDRFDDEKIIISGEYESVKDCLEKNRSVNLCSADLYSADLYSANLSYADLSYADLRSADLRSADLSSANLYSANLEGIKGYSESHDIFTELCRQQKSKTFTEKEWAIIGFVSIHRICWDAIKERYGKKIMPIFKKLSKKGWGEFEKKYAELLKGVEA